MKTSIINSNRARDSTEERVTQNWAAEYAKHAISKHREASIIDHPDKSVTESKIADNAVTTSKIKDIAVTPAKLADGAVTRDKIADCAINNEKLDVGAVHTSNIFDEAVTTKKLENYCVTTDKLAEDVTGEMESLRKSYDALDTALSAEVTNRTSADTALQQKINDFICADYNPIYLTDCPKTTWGYNFPPDAEINKFFKLENDTDSALTEFRGHDDYYTPLSCAINPGETRICVLLKKPSGGAEPQNGYMFVLDGTNVEALRTLISNHQRASVLDHPDKSVIESKLADGAVTTSKVADGAITRAKMADGAVTRDIIADCAVNDEKLDVGAVHTYNIFDEAVTTIKIDTEAVTEEKLAPDVTAKLHTHTNKSVLDGITADDIAAWDSIKEQVSKTQLDEAIAAEEAERTESDNTIIAMLNAAKAYLEDMCFSFTDEFQRVYAAIGVTMYDGGIFGMEQSDIALDGGDFTEETTGNVDCGGFEPLTAEVSAVVDGGEY